MSQVTEDTPLLSDPTADGSGFSSDEPNPSAVEIHQKRCAQAIFILTWHSALLAVFLLGSHLTIMAIHYIRTGDAVPWGQEVVEVGLLCTLVVAGMISFLNLARLYLWNRPMWLWLNLILDIAIVFYSIGGGLQTLGDYGWGPEEPLWSNRIIRVISGFAIIFGLIHFALFLVRCFLSFSYRPWRGYRNWRFPAGRLSVEFKVQFIRQAEEPDSFNATPPTTRNLEDEAVDDRV